MTRSAPSLDSLLSLSLMNKKESHPLLTQILISISMLLLIGSIWNSYYVRLPLQGYH